MGIVIVPIILLWLWFAYKVSSLVWERFEVKRQRTFVGFSTAFMFLLPFSEEIYISFAFPVHCAVYGGERTIEPVNTTEIALFANSVDPIKLFENEQITAVKVYRSTASIRGVAQVGSYWLTRKNTANCDVDLSNSVAESFGFDSERLKHVQKQFDVCYLVSEHRDTPVFAVRLDEIWHHSFSKFLPYTVWEDRYFLENLQTGQVKATFSTFKATPGRLRQLIGPNSFHKCYGGGPLAIYKFLDEAII